MTKKTNHKAKVIEFEFEIYPYFRRGPDDGERLILKGGKITFERCYGFDDSNLVVSNIPSDWQWDEFLNSLDRINIWNWNKNYRNQHVCDGYGWYLLIKTTSLKLMLLDKDSASFFFAMFSPSN